MWGKFCDFPHIFLYLCFQKNGGYVSKVFDQETGKEKQG